MIQNSNESTTELIAKWDRIKALHFETEGKLRDMDLRIAGQKLANRLIVVEERCKKAERELDEARDSISELLEWAE